MTVRFTTAIFSSIHARCCALKDIRASVNGVADLDREVEDGISHESLSSGTTNSAASTSSGDFC